MQLRKTVELAAQAVYIEIIETKELFVATNGKYRFKYNGEEPEWENIKDDAEFKTVADAYDALIDDEQ